MDSIIQWLLDGDVSIQYLTRLELLGESPDQLQSLQKRIETEGYGARFLASRNENGHWGIWFYQPKWTCTHYTLLDLKEIGIPRDNLSCREMVIRALNQCMLDSGGINFAKSKIQSDMAIDGMFLNYAAFFCPEDARIERLASFIIRYQKADGGFSMDPGGLQSDPHTTLCVLEGFAAYRKAGFTKFLDDINYSESTAIEWLLAKDLFMSDDVRYRKFSFPYRYRYDLLRVLAYFSRNHVTMDSRMEPAIQWLIRKKDSSGCWYLENIHHGNVHFHLEEKGKPSRFVTLKALFILKNYYQSDGLADLPAIRNMEMLFE